MRVLRTHRSRCLLLAFAALLSGIPAGAGADDDSWRAVLAAPALQLRFEDSGRASPCAPLPATPDPEAVACWAAHVDRSVSKRSSPLTSETKLACVGAWEVIAPEQGGCPSDAARCVRPELGLFDKLAADLPIDTNISATWALSEDLAREYTAFQTLRSGHALNPHRPRIAGLALSQGMLVLYRAHAISELRRELEAEGCAVEHLEPYLELAEQVALEVGRSDVPAILETFPPLGREWARRFHRVQLAVIGGSAGVRASGKWQSDCEKAREIGPEVGRLDADVNVWCGYAYEQSGTPDLAAEHWRLARRSPNHPAAASYATRRLEWNPEGSGETTAELRR